MTKRELELMYDRTYGEERARYYREWRRLVEHPKPTNRKSGAKVRVTASRPTSSLSGV